MTKNKDKSCFSGKIIHGRYWQAASKLVSFKMVE